MPEVGNSSTTNCWLCEGKKQVPDGVTMARRRWFESRYYIMQCACGEVCHYKASKVLKVSADAQRWRAQQALTCKNCGKKQT
jgi:hypothetical protein